MRSDKLANAVRQFRAITETKAPEGRSDGQLLRDFVARRDEVAFEVLMRRHGPMVFGVCLRVLRNVHDAEDAFQGAFVVLARRSATLGQREIVGNWLHGVAYRTALKARAAAARRRAKEQTLAKQEQTIEEPDQETLAQLDCEINRLPAAQRAVVVLCDLEGKTYKEAARLLGCADGTVGSRLARAHETLARKLGRDTRLPGLGLAGLAPKPSVTLITKAVQAVTVAAPAPVVALADSIVRGLLLTKLKSIGAVTLALTVVGLALGVLQFSLAAQEDHGPLKSRELKQFPKSLAQLDKPPLPEEIQPKQPAPGRDLFDNLLPKHAVARLGTAAFRQGSAGAQSRLLFTADGKHLVSVGGGWIRRWDVATGRETASLGQGTESAYDSVTLVSEDGKLACIYRDAAPGAEAKGPQPKTLTTIWEGTEYDLETGKERRKFRLNFKQRRAGQPLNAAWMSSDGKMSAALIISDVAVWNTEKGELTQKILHEKGEAFWTMVVSNDEKTLIVSDNGGLMHVHDMATGKRLRSFGVAGDSPVKHMSISPDGKRLVSAGNDSGLLRVWNFAKGTEEKTLKCPDAGNVVSMVFSADSQIIVSGSLTGFPGGPTPLAVRTWNIATGKPMRDWTGDPWRLGSYVAVSPNGKVLATMNFYGVISFWNMETGQALPAAAASPCGLEAVAFLADGKSLFTLGRDYEIRKWDAATGRLVGTQLKLREENKVEIFASDKLVGRASRASEKLDVMDTTTGGLLLTAEGDEICLTPDNKTMATGSKDFIRVYDLQAGKLLHSWKVSRGLFAADGSAPVLRGITPDGRAVVLHSNKVAICDAATGEVKSAWSLKDSHIFDGLDDTPKLPKAGAKTKAKAKPEDFKSEPKTQPSVAVSQDGDKIALLVFKSSPIAGGTGNYQLTVHDTATGKIIHKTEVPQDGGRPVLSFSPDGKLLAWGGHFKIYVWQIGNEKPAWVLEGHRSFIKSLSFSRDSGRMASASWDSTALIWDLKR